MILAGRFSIGKALADDLRHDQAEAASITQFFAAVVETESLFVKVAKQMIGFDTHVGSMNPALKETPEIFEPIGVNLTVNVGHSMVDDLVGVLSRKPFVGFQLVAVKRGARLDVLLNFGLESLLLSIVDNSSSDFPATLQDSHHCGFIFRPAAGDASLPLCNMHVACLAADEGFIDFDFSGELYKRIRLHGLAYAMEHEPCRLLSNVQVTRNFVRTDSVLAVCNHPHRHEPLVETDRAILEDGSDLDTELPTRVNLSALPHAASSEPDILASASRTGYTARPSSHNQVIEAVVGIREIDDCFLKGGRFRIHVVLHDSTVPQNRPGVKYILTLAWACGTTNGLPIPKCVGNADGQHGPESDEVFEASGTEHTEPTLKVCSIKFVPATAGACPSAGRAQNWGTASP